MEQYRSIKNLQLYNEFGQEGTKNVDSEVVTDYDRQMKVATNVFTMIVQTVKAKWVKFMSIVDSNLSKLKNRIDVAKDPMEKNNIKVAFTNMTKVKNFNNPMKRILFKANAAYAKVKRSKDPQEIAEGKAELMDLRAQQKEVISGAKSTLDEAKQMLGNAKQDKMVTKK